MGGAYSRDPILRTTAPFVLGFQEGATVTREGMEEFLDAQEPERFSKPIEEQLVGWNPDLTKQNEALH